MKIYNFRGASFETEEQFRDYCSSIPERELDIFISRNALYGHKKMTLNELGEKYNLTKERIRQLESKTTKQIIMGINILKLGDYYNK